MARTPPLLLAWLTYVLMFSSAFILLGAISASQRFCGRAAANSLTTAGGASYFANVSCDKLYRLTWFTVWYQIAMIIIVPVVLAMGAVHKWRYGLIGLLVPVTYLLMKTANAFYLQEENLDSNEASSRTMLAGAIIGSISNYVLIILFGVRDEKATVGENCRVKCVIIMRGSSIITAILLIAVLQCVAGRSLSSTSSPLSEDAVNFNFTIVLADANELPPAKCFTEETTTRSADSASCLTLPPGSTGPGVPESRASITCGKSTIIPSDKLGSCPDAQATLDAHNAARARYGAAPLLWSKTLTDFAQTVSNTCRFAHSNGPYGENLAIGSGLSCKAALDLWVAEESKWPPGGTPGFSSATGHFSAVVWKSTTQVGCATRSCSGRNFVTCSYNPAGNVLGQFNTQVGRLGDTPECTATTGTPIVPSPPTTSTPPRSPPPPPPRRRPRSPPPPPSRRCCYFYICFPC